ncbi:hypothetical protein [Arthrobacter sp.]|uniref:hypothetical protein n=1 Tax=Arthrobacter sp. TaxID=1667 RepID=UPI00289EE408|nr:hypothetical protein [Arthrobacter sp.]
MVDIVPDREPALDEAASIVFGADLEELGGLSARQPFISRGPWLNGEAVNLLDAAAESGQVGRFQRAGRKSGLTALVEAGLMDAAGRLTPEGITVTAPLTATQAAVSIHCLHPQGSSALQIQMDDQDALILAGPSRTELDAGRLERYESLVQLDFVGLAELAPVVASWLGLGPAWTLTSGVLDFPTEVFDRRLASPDEPPPTEEPAWVRMWGEPWFIWRVQVQSTTAGAVPEWGYVDAGRAGLHLLTVDEERASLEPMTSGMAYRDLVSAFTDF